MRIGVDASRGCCNTRLLVTDILLVHWELRVIRAIRQDKDINAISIARGVDVRGIIAGVVVAGVCALVA